MGVENKSPQRFVGSVSRLGNVLYDRFEHVVYADAGLRADQYGFRRVQPDKVFNFLTHPVGIGAGQVNFIDDRNDFQIMFQGQVHVCQCLRFYALRCVDDEQRPLAGRQAAGYFVVEVDMARCVD